jgi:replicative DNA helicase
MATLSNNSPTIVHLPEVEKSLLAGCLVFPEKAETICQTVQAGHFLSPTHQRLFAAIATQVEQTGSIDLATLTDGLTASGHIPADTGWGELIATLMDHPAPINYRDSCEKLIDAATRRQLMLKAQALMVALPDINTPLEIILATHADALDRLGDQAAGDDLLVMPDALDRAIESLELAGDKGAGVGVPTGLPRLDIILSRLKPGEHIILAARPAMGKSALAKQMVVAAAKAGYPAGIFTIEMTAGSVAARIIAEETGINAFAMRSGHLNQDHWRQIMDACGRLSGLKIFFNDRPYHNLLTLRAGIAQMVARGARLIVVDYLQLVDGDRQHGRVREVGSITRALKIYARKYQVPIVTVAQLNRKVEERSDKRPMLADLRDSGEIEQDADAVLFLYRPGYYQTPSASSQSPEPAEIIVAKQRNGPLGTVDCLWDGRTTSFKALPEISSE